MSGYETFLPDEAATEALGERLAAGAVDGLLVFLHGQLGAGKTTLVRGFLHAWGHYGRVKSPTYTLVEPYRTPRGELFHLDLYRLADAEELEWIGIRDLLDGHAVCLIEWPEQGAGILPEPDLHIDLQVQDAGRVVHLRPASSRGERVLQPFRSASPGPA
ncbi:MAG TPA: tRNA (adenosine(37)-N6)-threonylcarbamoyltransferase complex ATPase subunit type 1 TsaE [Gammaproteobacteria bacterium]|nr:tRNA (adenosine(37)-N6)-threonylcarbamoyltransferase complex ATPase subunit type 1 TsaE [Gammaproteobacteria bacterium]